MYAYIYIRLQSSTSLGTHAFDGLSTELCIAKAFLYIQKEFWRYVNANHTLAGITWNHVENQQGSHGKVLPVFADKQETVPYAFMHVIPGRQCHVLTHMSPFLAFYMAVSQGVC